MAEIRPDNRNLIQKVKDNLDNRRFDREVKFFRLRNKNKVVSNNNNKNLKVIVKSINNTDYNVATPGGLAAYNKAVANAANAEGGTGKKTTNTEKTDTNTTVSPRQRLNKTYRDRGGVLRYPFEAITEKTDYLQIDIINYEPVRDRTGSVIGRTKRISPQRSRIQGGLTNKSLVNKGTILLQIPSQVQDGNTVDYGSSRLNNLTGAAISGGVDLMRNVGNQLGEGEFKKAASNAVDSMKEALKSADIDTNTGIDLLTRGAATKAVGIFGANVTVNQLLQRESGQIFNPNMELLFNGPTLRNFRFSFKMTPRSRKEAEQCKLIIRSFKMNMAPKVTSGRGGSSLFLNTPNVFELRYKSGIRNHPFLHRFKQCFLTDISVNYTGEGVYATYEGREPVSMIMDLTFKELEPIYDQDYFDQFGFDSDTTVGF